MSRNSPTVTMPAGTYYIGDLCYVMHPEWNEFCDLTISGPAVLDGKFALADGREFISFSTAYGDGEYAASNGASLGVDAGLIGCIALHHITDPKMRSGGVINHDAVNRAGTIVTFYEQFECSSTDGVLSFGHIVVDTAGNTEYEDDYDDRSECIDSDRWDSDEGDESETW